MANNLFFEIDIDFLNAPLNAKMFKKDKQMLMVVAPQQVKNSQGMLLSEAVAKLGGGSESIKEALGDVEIKLSTAYLKYMTDSEAPAEEKPNMEYAVKLDVLKIDSIKIFDKIKSILSIKKITVAAWNTEDTAITDQMQLAIPQF